MATTMGKDDSDAASVLSVATPPDPHDRPPDIPSPNSIDPSLDTTLDLNKDSASDLSTGKSLGHQDDKITGGKNIGLRVLFCTNMPITLDYEEVYLLMKSQGEIQRIRLILSSDKNSFDCYIVYKSSASAIKAQEYFQGHLINDAALSTRMFHIDNFKEDPYDFLPQVESETKVKDRMLAIPKWFVASYKRGKENMIKAADCIRRKIGSMPDENLRRYGRAILIKAGNNVQSKLLENFKAPKDSNLESVSPHKTFNNARGVVYSKELFDFTEEEILRKCPENVWQIKKLSGTNNAVLLTFISSFLPDYIKVSGINFAVKKFRLKPTQCSKCFEYGHVLRFCENSARCFVCSGIHDLNEECKKNKFCLHCLGPHSPNWRQCSFYKFNQDIVEMAENEHISFGEAKRKLRRVPNNPRQTFASVLKDNPQQASVSTLKNNPLEKNLSPRSRPHETPSNSTNKEPHSINMNIPSRPNNEHNSIVVTAEVHNLLPDIQPVRDHDKYSVKVKNAVKPKNQNKTSISADGFWSPPRTKRGRPSSPQNLEIKTSNKFDILDPFGPLNTSRPLKKIALSSSCSDICNMETSNFNQTPRKLSREGKKDESLTSNKETTFKSKDASESKEKVYNKLLHQNDKVEEKGKRPASSVPQKLKPQSTNVKRLNYSFKSFNRNTSDFQSKQGGTGSSISKQK